MAINLLNTGQTLSPAFNPIVFYVNSTNKNEQNFRYIVDVYSATTANRIGSFRLAPEIGTGYGLADIGQLLSSQLSKDIYPNSNCFKACTNDYFDYDLSLGEEYVFYWPFDDSTFTFGPSPFVGQTTLSSSTEIHYFQSGDTINVSQPGGLVNGVFTVLDTPDAYSVVINNDHVNFSAATGTSVYSDYASTVFFNLNSSAVTRYTAFNGAVAHQDFRDYYASAYTKSTNLPDERKFLTTVPDDYRVTLDNIMWLHYYDGQAGVNVSSMCVQTDTGGAYRFRNDYNNTLALSGETYRMSQVAVGPYNLVNFTMPSSVISGGTSIATMFSGVSWYDVYLEQLVLSTRVRVTEKKRFYINDKCFDWPNVELYFVDRLGSFIPANFQLKSIKSINVNKNSYTKQIGKLIKLENELIYGYDSIDDGQRSIGITEAENLSLESNYLTEAEMNFMRELITSPRVYIKENGKLWPVIVNDVNFEITRKINKKNFTAKVNITKANNNIINNING